MNTQQRLDASMEFMERSNQEFNPGGNLMRTHFPPSIIGVTHLS